MVRLEAATSSTSRIINSASVGTGHIMSLAEMHGKLPSDRVCMNRGSGDYILGLKRAADTLLWQMLAYENFSSLLKFFKIIENVLIFEDNLQTWFLCSLNKICKRLEYMVYRIPAYDSTVGPGQRED